jgi:hypothetical protein
MDHQHKTIVPGDVFPLGPRPMVLGRAEQLTPPVHQYVSPLLAQYWRVDPAQPGDWHAWTDAERQRWLQGYAAGSYDGPVPRWVHSSPPKNEDR